MEMNEVHIRLYNDQGSYVAEVLDLPAGSVAISSPLQPPPAFQPVGDMNNYQSYLLGLENRGAANLLSKIGYALFNFLFGPDNPVHQHWNERWNATLAAQGVMGMRTVLHIEDDMLLSLPWELLNNNGDYLAALEIHDRWHTIVRTRWNSPDGLGRVVPSPGPDESLRLLLLICHAEDDDQTIMGPLEALNVDAAFYRLLPWTVDVHVLVRPSFIEISEWCRDWKPHVVHYVGHGAFDFVRNQSVLRIYSATQQNSQLLIDGEQMLTFFGGGDRPRLVVLNACRSGQPAENLQTGLSDAVHATQAFAETLIKAGVLAVVGMQADIDGSAAATLAGSLYQALGEGCPLDIAMAKGRHRLMLEGAGGTAHWDWALPAFYLAQGRQAEQVLQLSADGAEARIFQFEQPMAQQLQLRYRDLSLYLKIHVGRDKDRWKLERDLLRDDSKEAARVKVLHGESGIGKTTMLHWLAERCVRRGRQFIYADFGHKALDYLAALKLIRDGQLPTHQVGTRLNTQLNPEPFFNRFNYILNGMTVDGYRERYPQMPEQVQDETLDADPGFALKQLAITIHDEYVLKQISDAFLEGLAEAASQGGLVIFLDHIDKLSDSEVRLLKTHLIEPILNGGSDAALRNVRLALALRYDPHQRQADADSQARLWAFLWTELGLQPEPLIRFSAIPWLARVWARRYFISAGNRPSGVGDLDAGRLDEYVKDMLRPRTWQRAKTPKTLIDMLKDPSAIEGYLQEKEATAG